jgi:predicted RNase H-like nuclease (RuvC/YqgF family)
MLRKLEGSTAQISDLEKNKEDMVLQFSNYENKIHFLSTELQESQKEVSTLTDELNKKVRCLLLGQCSMFKV